MICGMEGIEKDRFGCLGGFRSFTGEIFNLKRVSEINCMN